MGWPTAWDATNLRVDSGLGCEDPKSQLVGPGVRGELGGEKGKGEQANIWVQHLVPRC